MDAGSDVISGPATFGSPVGLVATHDQLLLDVGTDSTFWISTMEASPPWGASVNYINYEGHTEYYGGGYVSGLLSGVLYPFDSYPVPTDQGSIGANPNWVIATVPEPGSLAILVIAVLRALAWCVSEGHCIGWSCPLSGLRAGAYHR